MKLIFSENQTIDLSIDNTPLGRTYQQIYKNLSRVPIPWRHWDNPFYQDTLTYPELVENLVKYGQQMLVDVDPLRCLDRDQLYFNQLHKIYEKNYRGDPGWLDFHEHIHMCETHSKKYKKVLCIDYREKAGLLEKNMDPDWLDSTRTALQAGDVYVRWSELGKTPYSYWMNNEPDDISRMCELVKPWLKLRPKIYIALEDTNLLENIERGKFESWWKKYHTDWVTHWGISRWTVENMFGVSVFGKTTQVELLKDQLKNNLIPTKVSLQ